MIELQGVVARVPPLALAPLTASLGGGIHALLGGKDDGPSVLLGVVAGRYETRGGSAQVLGFAAGDPRVRRSVAYVPLDVALPEPLLVAEALAAASRIRGEPATDVMARLERFGIGALAARKVRTLARDEARAVALAEALTSTARVLLVEEPLAAVDPRALGAVAEGLRTRAQEGACVLLATGSIRDARTLADDVFTFTHGAVVRRASASDPLLLTGPRGASVRVIASDPKRLATALATEDAVRSVAVEEGVLIAGGADVVGVAAAIARAALAEGIALEMLRPELLRESELRSAIAGDAAGAYRAAYERARGPGPRTPSAPPEEEMA